MMIRLPATPSLVTFALTSLALGGCLTPSIIVDTDDSATESSSTGETTGTSTTTDTDTDTDTAMTTTMPTTTMTTSPGVCGDGTVDAGEECDDGAENSDAAACTSACMNNICGDGLVNEGVEQCDDGNEANNDSCTSSCENNICGDGYVNEGVEICDDGVNDGSYGGCENNCAQLGPYCGDTFLQEEFEECDSTDIASGCLSTCKQAKSCLEIIDANNGAPSGVYPIAPEGVETLDAYCDMETDGGGYTFIKVYTSEKSTAAEAEVECAKYGMSLMIPRSPDHLLASWVVATSENLQSLGDVDPLVQYEGYVTIFGIYPVVEGETCVDSAFNHVDCPEWEASDGGPYFVSDAPFDVQPASNNCTGCSAQYLWNEDGTFFGYQSLKYGGYRSKWFMCDVGDKTP